MVLRVGGAAVREVRLGGRPVRAYLGDQVVSGLWFARQATLSGAGGLSVGVRPGVARAAVLAGGGSLSAAAVQRFARPAALSGTGSLAATAQVTIGRTAALAGSGTLSATSTPSLARSAGLSGAGSLAVAAAPVSSAPPLSGLADRFDDGTIDTSLWTNWGGGAVETGGRLRLPSDATYATVSSVYRYAFDATPWIRVWPAPADGAASGYTEFTVKSTSQPESTDVMMQHNAADGTLVMMLRVSWWEPGAATTIPYDPVAHAWWRVRGDGGTVVFETAPDDGGRPGEATVRRSVTVPASHQWLTTATDVALVFQTHRDGGTAGRYAEFDMADPEPRPLTQYGISMAGPEMGHNAASVPGTAGQQYTYSPIQWYEYAHSQGLSHFRIPFLAERAEARLGELMDHVAQVLAVDPGVTVTIDMHNYSTKYVNGVSQQLGTGWTNAQFAAEWVTIGSHSTVKNNPRVSFDLMNEPNNYTGYATERAAAQALEASHQTAVTALRNAGITNLLKVQPYSWGTARWIGDKHPSWWINDPLNRTILSAHFYFDYAGEFPRSYAEQEAQAAGGGYPTLHAQMDAELGTFITWINAQPGMPAAEIGEIGWPVQDEWCWLGDRALDILAASAKPVGWTYWGMNHWWDQSGAGNMMCFDFAGAGQPLTGNKRQVDVLQAQLDIGVPKTVTAAAPTFDATSYRIPPSLGVVYRVGGQPVDPGVYQDTGSITVTAEAKNADYMLSGTSSWTGTLQAATVTRNLVLNPRGKSGGADRWFANVGWGSAASTFRTGQSGWGHGTTTDVAYTTAAANTSSGNYVGYTSYSTTLLDGVADGEAVPVTAQIRRSLGGDVQLVVSWMNGSGVEVKEDGAAPVTAAAGEVTTLTHQAVKPAGAVRFLIEVRAPSAKAGETVAATNMALGSSIFFDGATPDTATVDHAWTGAADASISTRTETA